ncbi:MAG TPA: hypothetical protein VH595_19385 [Verrucomicrobiae bacterium]|jgi:hypothetical protein|nr:hypothetical protein [Verrucomicrobiae bacterium]
MKIRRLIKYAAITLTGLALAIIAPRAQAQVTFITDYTNTFDNDGNTTPWVANQWMYWYSIYADCIPPLGTYNLTMTNDPTMDADGNTNVSGSLLCYSPFAPPGVTPAGGSAPIPSGGDQNLMSGVFAVGSGIFSTNVLMKIASVTNISFKIHVLPGTVTDANGNFGAMEVGFKSQSYNADTGYYTNELTIPGAATNGWVLMQETNAQQFQYAAENSGDSTAQGVEFYYTSYSGYPTNPVMFWIDDLQVHSSVVAPPPPPPPTLSISQAVQGLNLFTASGGSSAVYNRENIEASQANYSWVNASGPVSYSFTITNYPVGSNDGVQCQIFLCPSVGTENDPDWAESNIIFLDMENNVPNNTVYWSFRYKTNEANGNTPMLYGSGVLATIGSSTAIGTWTLTFNDNTNVTMTVPGGASTNFSIPDSTGATTALFANGVDIYFGDQAGNAGGVNDHIVASDFKVIGLGSADFDDNFVADAGTLNSVWTTNAAFPSCVQLVGPGEPYWVQWTAPATGFALQSTPTLLNPTWTLVTNNPTFTAGTNFTQLISTNDYTGTNAAFFGLVQRTFTQLQVLLTGETAAPGTPTGKTGTPTPFNGVDVVTVNAVDAKFYPVPGISDNITLTSTDDSLLFGTGGANASLVNGTYQYQVAFQTSGDQTVTITDTTDTNIPPATSAPVNVPQQ